jgi:sporulation protein YqfC
MASNIKQPKKKKNKSEKPGFKELMAEMLELPKDIVLVLPKITIVGHRNAIVENYKGLVEYENDKIRLNTNAGMIRITGKCLTVKAITSEDILLEGDIESLEFLK